MTDREYRMGKRLESTERTRTSIIEAARALLAEGGLEEFSVQRIAERAGVTRPTVYGRFGTRRELLEALVADAEQRAGLAAARAVSEDSDPVDGMVGWLRAAVAFWASEHTVLAPAYALSRADPDLSGVLAAHDEARRRRAKGLARRLASGGMLRGDCSRVQAADTLWLVSSFAVYEELSRNSRTPASITRTVLQLAMSALITPDRPPS